MRKEMVISPKKSKTLDKLHNIEDDFKVICNLLSDIGVYPLTANNGAQFNTDKNKSREFAEVFTPLHIVDEMLDLVPQMSMTTNNLDLCSGYGQFSIRILRKLYKIHGEKLDIKKYLKSYHYFSELQVSSCFKLLWIFSTDINLYIGDALKLGKLPAFAKGIWYYLDNIDDWVNITGFVQKLYKNIVGNKIDKSNFFFNEINDEQEQLFVKGVKIMETILNKTTEEYKGYIKQLVRTKEGRQSLIGFMSEAASNVERNWQEHETPEWLVREMINTVPDVTQLKKILVLFNIEFLECLVKEKGIDPSRIDFGFDSEIEGELAKKIYGVTCFTVGNGIEILKSETVRMSDLKNGYDVIFSNPPYQVQSESQKGRDGAGSKQAKAIYHEIVMHTIDSMKPHYLCMITPSRWMVGGMGLGAYRIRMLADKRIKTIVAFPGASEVFKGANIPGGVSYFLWDRDYSGLCTFDSTIRDINEFDVLVRDNISCQILRKVISKTTAFCNEKVLPKKPFGLPTNFKDWIPEVTPGAVPCYTNRREIKYVLPTSFSDSANIINLWKVYGAAGTGHNGEVFSKISNNVGYRNVFVGNKGTICTETYIVIASFKTKEEAENYLTYTQTKFYQIMLSLRVITQDINIKKFAWVPDFGNYNHAYTDADLYTHFGLTKKEIEHIEKSIKSIK